MNFEELLNKHKEVIENQGGFSVVAERLMKSEIYLDLARRLNKNNGETIELSHQVSLEHRSYIFDIFFPKGISYLNIPANSIIEIKRNLIADAIHRTNEIARLWKQKYPGANIYLVYGENSIVSDDVIRKSQTLKLSTIYKLDDFKSEIRKKRELIEKIEQEEHNWRTKRDAIIDSAKFYFRENNCTLFLGAGVSQDAGGPSWNSLLSKSVKKMCSPLTKQDFKRIYNSCSMSPIIMGRYITGNKITKGVLTRYLHDYVLYKGVDISQSQLISSICDIVSTKNIESIITYNYDDLIETALRQKGIEVASIYSKSRFLKGEIPVYHVHGLIPQDATDIQSTPILSEEDYHIIYRESYHWSNVEQLHALDRNTCFFIGLSMSDPNLRRLLDISNKDSDKEVRHFAFLKREKLYNSDFQHEKNEKHLHIIEDQLENLGVNIIWYEEYREIPIIIEEIGSGLKFI